MFPPIVQFLRAFSPQKRMPSRIMSPGRPVDRDVKEHLPVIRNDRTSAARHPSRGKTNDKGIGIVSLEIRAVWIEQRVRLVTVFARVLLFPQPESHSL